MSSSITALMRARAASSACLSETISERACSYCMSVCNSPIAAVMPGATGTMISLAAIASASAAERHQGEVTRVDAARHRVGADGERHVGIDDLDDAERRVLDREAERLGHLGLDRLVGEVGVKRQVGAQHLVDVEPSEHDLRVGDRRLGTAAAVTGGAGLGACRARTDMEAAGGIDIGDGAAAGGARN